MRTITLAAILLVAIAGLSVFGAYAATQGNQWASVSNDHADGTMNGMMEDMNHEDMDSEMEEIHEHCFEMMGNHGMHDHEEHDHP